METFIIGLLAYLVGWFSAMHSVTEKHNAVVNQLDSDLAVSEDRVKQLGDALINVGSERDVLKSDVMFLRSENKRLLKSMEDDDR